MPKAKPRVGDRINLPETASSQLPDTFFNSASSNGDRSSLPGRRQSVSVDQPARAVARQAATSPPVLEPSHRPPRRKATFRLSPTVLDQLGMLHSELQQEFGRGNIPSKEIMVEEAIAQFLAKSTRGRKSLLAKLKERQRQR